MGCSSSSGSTSSSSSGGSSGSGSGTVSFATDVMPIFQQGCTLTTECHGQVNEGEENLYLGAQTCGSPPCDPSTGTFTNTSDTITQTYKNLVGANALENPAQQLVKAGDSADSYLYVKLTDTQVQLNGIAGCAQGMCNFTSCTSDMQCGTTMPYGNSQLDGDPLAKIKDWIDQGALNN